MTDHPDQLRRLRALTAALEAIYAEARAHGPIKVEHLAGDALHLFGEPVTTGTPLSCRCCGTDRGWRMVCSHCGATPKPGA